MAGCGNWLGRDGVEWTRRTTVPDDRVRARPANMRILVVEDEEDLAGAVAAGLRREGYAVDVARDGCTALDRLGTTPTTSSASTSTSPTPTGSTSAATSSTIAPGPARTPPRHAPHPRC